jgi:MYXO-CTERM domain-containing protein
MKVRRFPDHFARKGFAIATLLAGGPVFGAQINFDNGAGTGTWENPLNWRGAGPDTFWGTDDDTDGLPVAADQAVIGGNFIATLTSAQTVSEVGVQWPGQGGQTAGSSVLNIGPGAALTVTGASGVRLGRAFTGAVGSTSGTVNQTGGSVVITGNNGLRLSQESAAVQPDSLYVISGGSLTGGTPDATGSLNVGRLDSSFNRAEFRVVGSGASEIRFEDVNLRAAPPAEGTGTRQAVLSFVVDDGGVTPIVVEDQFDIQAHDAATGTPTGNALLEISLQGAPAESDIVLVNADRLTPTSGTAGFVNFLGMPDGTPIMRSFGNYEYTWNLDYVDGNDDGLMDAFIRLDFVSRTEVPEPGALGALGLGAFALVRRRRGRR